MNLILSAWQIFTETMHQYRAAQSARLIPVRIRRHR
jgi:hypothetical protein